MHESENSKSRVAVVQGTVLILVCICMSWIYWLKLNTLWGDPGLWLFQSYRASIGELPYVDFTWSYPPLSLYIVAASHRLFGASFQGAQIVLICQGLLCVVLVWRLAARLTSVRLAFVTALCFSIVEGVALFSLNVYSPTIVTGSIGVLMALVGLVDRVRRVSQRKRSIALVSVGAFIAAMSKPEHAFGVGLAFLAAWYVDASCTSPNLKLNGRKWIGLAALSTGPAAAVYITIGLSVGFARLAEGISGYGLATVSCPWWPTGLGLFGAVAALSQFYLVLVALNFLAYRGSLAKDWLAKSAVMFAPFALSIVLGYIYVFYGTLELRLVLWQFFRGDVSYPSIAWPCILVVVASTVCLVCSQRLPEFVNPAFFVCLAGLLGLLSRGLFSFLVSPHTTVPTGAVALLFAVAPTCLDRSRQEFARWTGVNRVTNGSSVVVGIFLVYAFVGLASVVRNYAPDSFTTLITRAGEVRLRDYRTSAAVYEYVENMSSLDDRLLDLTYGGGVNFATQRNSPAFLSQYTAILPSQAVMETDARRVISSPPDVVIARNMKSLGTQWGVPLPIRCPCPLIVWKAREMATDESVVFPTVEYLSDNYYLAHSWSQPTVNGQPVADIIALVPRHNALRHPGDSDR